MPKIITIPAREIFIPPDRFKQIKETKIKIEHSLVAIAKWEAKWHIPFLDDQTEKTAEMMLDYIRCMTISQNVDPDAYYYLTEENIKEINEYIDDPMTATWFNDKHKGGKKEVVTSEVVYYWMIAQQIPPEYDKWHFNRLMTLIRVCSEKNAPGKKMSKKDILSSNRALNEARKKALHTRG